MAQCSADRGAMSVKAAGTTAASNSNNNERNPAGRMMIQTNEAVMINVQSEAVLVTGFWRSSRAAPARMHGLWCFCRPALAAAGRSAAGPKKTCLHEWR